MNLTDYLLILIVLSLNVTTLRNMCHHTQRYLRYKMKRYK